MLLLSASRGQHNGMYGTRLLLEWGLCIHSLWQTFTVCYWRFHLRCHPVVTHPRWVNTGWFALKCIGIIWARSELALGTCKHTNCVVFHSITTLEVVNMACCFAATTYYYMIWRLKLHMNLNLLKICDSYNPCCALFRIKDARYLKCKQKASFRTFPMQR